MEGNGGKNRRDREYICKGLKQMMEKEMTEDTRSLNGSEKSRYSEKSSSIWGAGSGISEGGLSSREVFKIKRLVMDKEREDRKRNVVIKGLKDSIDRREGSDRKEDIKIIENFFKEKLGVCSTIENCRRSGPVIIVKLESDEGKVEIMRNKLKLIGEKIFIENDLCWEDRKIQEEINKWAKERKGKGEDIKVGYGRVKVGGIWKNWEEIKKEEANREEARNFD